MLGRRAAVQKRHHRPVTPGGPCHSAPPCVLCPLDARAPPPGFAAATQADALKEAAKDFAPIVSDVIAEIRDALSSDGDGPSVADIAAAVVDCATLSLPVKIQEAVVEVLSEVGSGGSARDGVLARGGRVRVPGATAGGAVPNQRGIVPRTALQAGDHWSPAPTYWPPESRY